MRFLTVILGVLLLIGVVIPMEAGLDPAKKKTPKIIKADKKLYKKYSTKKYSTKQKKLSKKKKPKTIEKVDTVKPSEAKVHTEGELLAQDQLGEQKVIESDKKPMEVRPEADVERVAGQSEATITRDGKFPEEKGIVSEADINQFSDVEEGTSKDISVEKAGGG